MTEKNDLESVLQKVDPEKRAFLKKLVLGVGFAVPLVASYAVKDLAHAQMGSPPATTGTTTTTPPDMTTTTPMSTF